MNNQPLPFDPSPEASGASTENVLGEFPLVYIACPLTRTRDLQRDLTNFVVDKIMTIVTEHSHGAVQYRTHAPAVMSSPWAAADVKPDEIYQANTKIITTEVDAMIVLALDGGSDGTGHELGLANQRGVPVLRLAPTRDSVSRQVAGNPLVATIAYDQPLDLASKVTQFLNENKDKICHGPRRRRNKQIIYAPLQSDLYRIWGSYSSDTARGRVAAAANVIPKFVDHWLSHPLMVAALSYDTLLALTTAMNVDLSSYFSHSSVELSIAQLETLIIAKDEYGWNESQTEWLRSVATAQLASPGVKRLLLNNPGDWLRLFETHRQ